MKKTKLLNVRYLVLITLGSANLFLFQNCSNYSGQVSISEPKELQANKDLSAIAENSPALIEIGSEIASEPPYETPTETQVIVQIDPPAIDESAPPAETIEMPAPMASLPGEVSEPSMPSAPSEASGTITTVISSSGMESTDQVGTAPAEPPPAPVEQPTVGSVEQSSAAAPSAEESSGEVAATEPTSSEPILGAIELPTEDSNNGNDDHDGDQRNDQRDLPSLPPAAIVNSSSVTVMPPAVHGGLCRLLSVVGNQLLKIPVVALGDDSNGKDVTIPNGKVIVISSSSSVLQLNKLAVGGNAILCGDIKIKNFDAHGNATLIYAQAEQASVDGKLITARLSGGGIQVDVDTKSGNSVKSCSVGEDLKIVSNSSNSSNSHSNKNK